MGWKLFQLAIFLAFMVANIEIFHIDGIAGPVMGGMLAWYLTGIMTWLIGLLGRAYQRFAQ